MIRIASALVATALAAAPALATSYSAKPIAQPGQKVVARDVIWACGPAACQGSTHDSRPAIVCQSLAKKVGRLENFVADGRAFASAELDRCNAVVRDGNAAVANRVN
ncbi:MAG TPA: hypothetical protein VFK50_08930 [Sphingomicrobium sp.]|nr:hypothetical protein [Sphingomicrobium sp.]